MKGRRRRAWHAHTLSREAPLEEVFALTRKILIYMEGTYLFIIVFQYFYVEVVNFCCNRNQKFKKLWSYLRLCKKPNSLFISWIYLLRTLVQSLYCRK